MTISTAGSVLPTGAQFELVHGEQHATITAVGASLREYRVGGRDVVLPFGAGEIAPAFSGATLAPWPNRLADGMYAFHGSSYLVPLTEHARQTALHGLVAYVAFEPTARSDESVTLAHTLVPTPGYPWPVRVEVTYTLSDEGLRVTTDAVNLGTSPAPYGLGFHPWLSPGDADVDDCTLTVGALRHITVDGRLLPTGDEALEAPYDLREPQPLRGIELDDAWVEPVRDDQGRTWARLASPDGRTVAMWADESFEAWQVCSGDGIERIDRRGVAVEPMTCVADAFRTGDLLVELEPGHTTSSTWGLRLE